MKIIKKKLGRFSIIVRKFENNIMTASVIIFGLALLTKVLGFVKLRLIAQTFGASRELDIFWASFVIPDLVFMLIIGGSVNAALLPAFVRLKKHNEKKLRQVFNVVLFLTLILWLILWAILILVFKFSGNGVVTFLVQMLRTTSHVGKLGLNQAYYMKNVNMFITLTILMFASSLFLALSSIIGAFLLSYKRFVVNNLSPLLYNLGIILAILLMQMFQIVNVYYLAWAIVFGSFLHFAVQFGFLFVVYRQVITKFAKDVYYTFAKKTRYVLAEVKHIFTVAIPRMLGVGIEQVTVFFNTFWALALGAGALSIYKFALSLHFLPIHLIGHSIAQAVFPSLNETREKGKKKQLNGNFTRLFTKSFVLVLLLAGYTAVIIFVLKTPIVQILLGGGNFTQGMVYLTSLTLGVLSLSIILNSVLPLIIRVYYVLEETKIPFLISLVGVFFNIVLGVMFSNLFGYDIVVEAIKKILWYGDFTPAFRLLPQVVPMMLHLARGKYSVVGLALGMSLGLIPEFLIAVINLKKRFPHVFDARFFNAILGAIYSITIAGLLAFGTYKILKNMFIGMNLVNMLIGSALVGIVGLIPLLIYYFLIYDRS